MITLVLLLSSIAGAEHRFWQWTTPNMNTDREIVLADLLLFRLSEREALDNRRWSSEHKDAFDDQVKAWNKPIVAFYWCEECNWRYRCWRELADALNPHRETHNRINDLYNLRELIGREAFYSGVMPSPIPQYKFLPNR